MTLLMEKALPRERQATVGQLVERLYRADGKAEIVNGEIIKLMSTGDEPNTAAFNVALV